MKSENKPSRILGIAFLVQYVISIAAHMTEVILKQKIIKSGSIGDNLVNIANNTWLLRTNIFGEILTAFSIIFLGTLLFVILKKQNEKIAAAGLGFFILAAGILVTSRFATYVLLRMSQEFAIAGNPAYLQIMGNLAIEFMDFGPMIIGLPFCFAEMLFCWLFYKSVIIPRILSIWGLMSIPLVLIWTIFSLSGYEVPFLINFPYAIFGPAIGVWIFVKGIKVD